MKPLRIIAICLFASVALVLFFFQSDFGKKIAIDSLKETLQDSGVQVEIGKFEGSFPHNILLTDLHIETAGASISIQTLSARLSLLALLKKEFLFTRLTANGISWQKKPGAPLPMNLKFAVTVKHFELTEVQLEEGLTANLEGSARFGKNEFTINLTGTRLGFPDSELRLNAYLDAAGNIRTRGSFQSPTLRALPLSLPFDASVNCQFVLGGKENLLGRVSGRLTPTSLEIEELRPYVEREWKVDLRVARKEGHWFFSRLKAENDLVQLSGKGKETSALLNLKTAEMRSRFEMTRLEGGGAEVKGTVNGEWARFHLTKLKAEGAFVFKDNALSGSGTALGLAYGNLWKGKTDFSWQNGGSLFLSEATLEGPTLSASGHLEIRQDNILLGETDLSIGNLHELNPNYYGKLAGKTHWLIHDGEQIATCDLVAEDVFYGETNAAKVAIDASLIDPFNKPRGRIVLAGDEVKWKELNLNRLRFETLLGASNQYFAIDASGTWRDPLELALQGTWRYENKNLIATLESGSGSFNNLPLTLLSKVDFEMGQKRFLLSPLDFSYSHGTARLEGSRIESDFQATLNLEHFPLDLFPSIGGETDCKISLQEKNGSVSGQLDAKIHQLTFEGAASASGQFQGQFENERLILSGNLRTNNSPLLDLDLSLPIRIELAPPTFHWVYGEKVGGHLNYNGRIEEILDFFNLGNHRIEGDIVCGFSLKNTLEDPEIEGGFTYKNGTYENYMSGTHLTEIEAAGTARGKEIHLDSFKAAGVTATGKIAMSPLDAFPFLFDVTFNRFQIAEIDLVSAEAEGRLQIVGNANTALAKGDLEILQTDLHIPDRIPRNFPNLVVVYKNVQKPIENATLSPKEPYPLLLDINVTAPEGIFIDGRGLDSEWKGTFHVGGTHTELMAQGKLELINGKFVFSGREFKLQDGSLSFRGKEHEMPILNLVGQMQVKDVLITATMKGPLNNPQLTLQSVPPLPMGTIMSYLLFGQELAEINSFQALQLANSVAALAGQGPDVLEKTRKALGVDRLNIVTQKSDDADVEDTIALQVGKYVSEGVLISLTQGAEDAAPDISIALELNGGWTIQLDSDQRQEQGKVTVRWNRTY
jgi:autotransporter translocation and assembly factor TamB